MTTNQGNATLVEKINNNAVILNGVSPWAKAGAKRSESLTETWAEAVGVMARAFHQTASAHEESAILHCIPAHLRPPGIPFRMTGCFFST